MLSLWGGPHWWRIKKWHHRETALGHLPTREGSSKWRATTGTTRVPLDNNLKETTWDLPRVYIRKWKGETLGRFSEAVLTSALLVSICKGTGMVKSSTAKANAENQRYEAVRSSNAGLRQSNRHGRDGQWLRAHTTVAKGLSVAPSNHFVWLTTACCSSCMGYHASSWPALTRARSTGACTYKGTLAYPHLHT